MAKHRLVVISPDADTDYCYLDMTDDEAVAQFRAHEDYQMYADRGYVPKPVSSEFDNSFLLWRNKGKDFADYASRLGLPDEVVRALRGEA